MDKGEERRKNDVQSGIYVQWNISHKNEIMPVAATWRDLEIVILSEVSWTHKDKYHMISFICGIFLKRVQMNLFTKQK